MADILEKDIVELTEITPEFDVDATNVATLENGDKIIHTIITPRLSNCFKACDSTIKELNKDKFTIIGIDNFCGFTEKELINIHPELDEVQVGIDDGKPIMQKRLRKNIWNYKNKPHLTGYFVVKAEDHNKYKAKLISSKKIKVIDIKSVSDEKTIKWCNELIKKEISNLDIQKEKVIEVIR